MPSTPSSRPTAPGSPEDLLRSLGSRVTPDASARDRIRLQLRSRIDAPEALARARELVTPVAAAKQTVWARISTAITPFSHASLWEKIREGLTPAADLRDSLWQRLFHRLRPAYAHAVVSRPLKWVAAFALVLFVVRLSPYVFLAPPSVAEASVIVLPTRGQVGVLIGGLWQPLSRELTLQGQTRLQTQDGEATIVLYDDAVIRLAPYTTVSINDFSDRPAAPMVEPSVSLQEGRMWVLGLIPKHLHGLTIGLSEGQVNVHEGSVSLSEDNGVDIGVWDRGALVQRRNQRLTLVAGEHVTLRRQGNPLVEEVADSAYDDAWVTHNLSRDAVHQREIAQMQQERRAASAGILPDSTLYPAKRLAEAVDVLFTFGTEAKAKKLLTHANTRFNEAAALITRGSGSDATVPLREYRETLLAVANNSGGNLVVSSLLEEVVDDASADVSAALPDDESYVLKQTVREAFAALPDTVDRPDMGGEALLDELTAVKRQAAEGDVEPAREKLDLLKLNWPLIDSGTGAISDDVRRELEATFTTLAAAVDEPAGTGTGSIDTRALRFIDPIRPSEVPRVQLSDAEVQEKAEQIRNRIFKTYATDVGRMRWMRIEFDRLEGNPDQGRILRDLAHLLPRDGLALYVWTEIRRVGQRYEYHQAAPDEPCTGSGCENLVE